MAGVGVRLNRCFEKKSIATDIVGIGYSVLISIAPILIVVFGILLMGFILQIGEAPYLNRELFSCTITYVLIFSLLAVSPFNAVLSRYVQDAIYEDRYQDILPCYYLGALMTMIFGCLMGIPFCLWEHFVGGVDVFYVFMGFCAYVSMILVFHSVAFLLSCKDFEKIAIFFLLGMVEAIVLAWILCRWYQWELMTGMLFSLMTGFLLIAILEFAAVKSYFRGNSRRYKPVLKFFGKWWSLVFTNFFYMLGIYVHNFVFWQSDGNGKVAESFLFNRSYDMATFIAMFTNISATVIFVAHMEMHFRGKYRRYSESVIGGKRLDIENAKGQMFRQLESELMTLARIQFIISVVLYLLCVVFAPQYGYGGEIIRIYPCLATGYFILFIMYAALIFLYYFNDAPGTIYTAAGFFLVTLLGSIAVTRLPEIWHGMGLVLGAFTGWTIAYLRLRWLEKNMDVHVFCQGYIIKRENAPKPSGLVYKKAEMGREGEHAQI